MAEKSLSESMAGAADRIQEIVDAAERVAADIRAEAEAEADRYLEARRRDADQLTVTRSHELQELSATIVGHATRVKQQAEELVRSLDAAIEKMSAAPPSDAAAKPVIEPRALPDPAPSPRIERGPRPIAYSGRPQAAPEPAGDAPGREDALVRATQMAVAGHERAEIESALTSEFGIASPGPLVDDILGAEAG